MKRFLSILTMLGSSLVLSDDLDDFGDHPGFSHAMDVRTESIDSFPVVFHYGRVRPSFEPVEAHPQRTVTALREGWRFRFDPENRGLESGWSRVEIPDQSGWQGVSVPHCWDVMPGGRFGDWSDRSPTNPPHYDGAAWYRLSVNVRKRDDKRYRIEFLGIPHRARLYLNGQQIALHEGGGQPFSLDVTKPISDGKNLLSVKIIRRPNHGPLGADSSKEPAELKQVHGPHPRAPDMWPYAGIIRGVNLIEEPPVTVRKTQLRTIRGHLEAAVVVTNHGTTPAEARVQLASPAIPKRPDQIVTIAPESARVVRFRSKLKSGAGKWEPGQPTLHTVAVRVTKGDHPIDEWRGQFGIRDFEVRGNRFLLNGKPTLLKGIALYGETPTRGAALEARDHERLLKQAREADANFLRLHVIQRSPEVYQLADQLGFMVTAEWGGFWYREAAMKAQTEDERSIYQSHARCALWDLMNHPSVVLWCIHNECHQFCPEYEPFVKMGRELVRSLDWQRRPVTWAAWHPHMGGPHFEHADVVGFNEYRGAMDPFEKLDPDIRKVTAENPEKPLLILENGAWAKSGQRGSKSAKGTEEWQADLLRRQHEVLKRHTPPLAGYTYWLLRDYRSRKFYTNANRGWSGMGMYSEDGSPKLVRDVFRDLQWQPQP